MVSSDLKEKLKKILDADESFRYLGRDFVAAMVGEVVFNLIFMLLDQLEKTVNDILEDYAHEPVEDIDSADVIDAE